MGLQCGFKCSGWLNVSSFLWQRIAERKEQHRKISYMQMLRSWFEKCVELLSQSDARCCKPSAVIEASSGQGKTDQQYKWSILTVTEKDCLVWQLSEWWQFTDKNGMFLVWQARMVLEREFNNLLARGTDRRLDEVSTKPTHTYAPSNYHRRHLCVTHPPILTHRTYPHPF